MYKCKATINDKEYSADIDAPNMHRAYSKFSTYLWLNGKISIDDATSLTIDEIGEVEDE